jgi:hypothetical protein
MPPVKATSPSTTRILRWSRLLTLPRRLTGLNSQTATPLARSFSKYSFGVLSEPTLSYRRPTFTPSLTLAASTAASFSPGGPSSRM